jgi:CBS domain-containing protein
MLGQLLGVAVLGLLIGKAVVWSVALGSGTSGGVLAPLLIMGGALGALLGQCMPAGEPGLWAMVGMAAMMGGTMRSPLTGMVFTLELTHDFNALPALLVGCVSALAVTVLLLKRSILTEKLARRGQHIAREYSVDLFELMRVGEVMDQNAPTVPAGMTVGELSRRIADGDPDVCRRHGLFILNQQGQLAGVITRGDILRSLREDATGERTVLEAGRTDLAVTYPDEPLHDALTKMLKRDIGRLPVVDRDFEGRLLGYLGRADILEARSRHLMEEELREQGPLLKVWNPNGEARKNPEIRKGNLEKTPV